ncbi:MAG: hypothetical protein AAGJ40_09625 [Planctomycetota bacterium]
MAKGGKVGGQEGNPGQTTEDEMDERIRYTASLLYRGLFKSQIKKELRTKYSVDARTVERYLSRAREEMLVELRDTRDNHKASSLKFYQSVLSDPKATFSNKIQAQKRIDFILGLHAPTQLSITDVDGKSLSPGELDEQLVALIGKLNASGGEDSAANAAEAEGEGEQAG